jgi:SAM-dependent methyltransferase
MSQRAEHPSRSLDVTEEVRGFYDRYPYPRPVNSLEQYRRLWEDPRRRRADYHLFWPDRPYREDHSILVAGCGTSQAAKHALRWPAAQVTGIDISATSVRCTEELKRKHNLKNLQVHHIAIEQANHLGMSFDQVVCTGVLHHLADPDAGLAALHDVLKPDGAMHLMVYAPYGRTGIYMLQEFCRRIGISATDEGIRDLIASLRALPPGHPLEQLLREAPDFRQEAGGTHPISFAGTAWPRYVPIRMSDTICVQERLPAGAAAVLINQNHTYRDLFMAISLMEKSLLDAIDGNCTIGDIVKRTLQSSPERSQLNMARIFFERLWWHDQVVFDASNPGG